MKTPPFRPRSGPPVCGVFGLFLALGLSCAGAAGPLPPIELISLAGRPSVTGSGDSWVPLLSGDGRWVAFQSLARNLVPGDVNGAVSDVFVQEVATGTTRLVSATPGGTSGNGSSELSGISRDGRFIVFVSDASDLVAGDDNEAADVFVRDRVSGVTRLVSVTATGASGSGTSGLAVMTPDGRYVAFESDADDLVAGDVNGLTDVFVRDLEAGTTRRVSVESAVPSIRQRAKGDASDVLLSDDGQTVVFRSTALNLAPPISGGAISLTNDLYWVRPPAETNRMVDVFPETANVSPNFRSFSAAGYALSADGRDLVMVLRSGATNMVPGGVFHINLDTGVSTKVTDGPGGPSDGVVSDVGGPFISADGRTVFYEAWETAPGASAGLAPVVYAWDAVSGTRSVVSSSGWVTNAAGEVSEGRHGSLVAISRDGAFVAFLGGSTNDVPTSPQNQLIIRHRASGEVRRVSRTLDGGPVAEAVFLNIMFSDDGHRLAFHAQDDSSVEGDYNGSWDALVYDWDSDTTRLVSRADVNEESLTPFGAVSLNAAGLSADGRYVGYVSSARGMVAGDDAGAFDAFRWDRVLRTNVLLSVRLGGGGAGDATTEAPVLSRDGRFAAFVSAAGNLVVGDTNLAKDVFLRDIDAGTTVLVSHRPDGGVPQLSSTDPAISPDGRWVAFSSTSPDLTPKKRNGGFSDVFLFDHLDGSVTLVTVNVTGTVTGAGSSGGPAFSPDGRWLLFESMAPDLVTESAGRGFHRLNLESRVLSRIPAGLLAAGLRNVDGGPRIRFSPDGRYAGLLVRVTTTQDSDFYVHDLETGDTVKVVGPVSAASLSAGASRVVYRTTSSVGAGSLQVRLLDRNTGADTLISAGPGGEVGDGPSDAPVISADGLQVAFTSMASNLVPDDDNGWTDLFIRDLGAGTTQRVGGDGLTTPVFFSADGRTLVFRSFASDLVERDYNGNSDLFALGWGTVVPGFTVAAVVVPATGEIELRWPAEAGRIYAIQSAESLGAPWVSSAVPVTVTGATATARVGVGSARASEFFRVQAR